MSWLGSPWPGATMWSMVQSSPVRSLLQLMQIGSSMVLANARALRQSAESCHLAIDVYFNDLGCQVEDVFVVVWVAHCVHE